LVSFKRKFLENIGWSAVGMAVRILCAGGTLALLSRLVDPGTMGLYGVAWAAAALGYNIGRSGAAQGIIALRTVEKSHIAAAQFLSGLLGLGTCALLVLAAPAIEAFYDMEGLGKAFIIGGLFVPVMCLPCVDMAVAQKELNFSRITIFQTIAVVLSSLTAIACALAGYDLVALFALQGGVGLYTFMLFRWIGQPVGLTRFTKMHVKAVWGIGGHLSFTSLTAVLVQNLPQLIMAKFLTAEVVGYYTFSSRIVQLIGQALGGTVGTVVYPTMSSIQADLGKIGRFFISSARYTLFALLLCLMVLVIAPGPFLDLYGGHQWEGSKNVLLFLAIAQMVGSLGANVFPTFQAIGRAAVGWKWTLCIAAFHSVIVYTLARYGVDAVAQGLAAAALVTPIAPYLLSRVAGFSFLQYARSMAGVVLPVFPAIAIGLLFANWTRDLIPLLAFLIPACAGAIVFVGVTVGTDRDLRDHLRKFIAFGRNRMSPRGPTQ
jgi:O-antigen/teichoic acid export membrane protein